MVGGKGPTINGRLLNREKSQLRAISEHTQFLALQPVCLTHDSICRRTLGFSIRVRPRGRGR